MKVAIVVNMNRCGYPLHSLMRWISAQRRLQNDCMNVWKFENGWRNQEMKRMKAPFAAKRFVDEYFPRLPSCGSRGKRRQGRRNAYI